MNPEMCTSCWLVLVQVANAEFMFPISTSRTHPGVQTLLQGFAWSEATRKADLALRNVLLDMYVKASGYESPRT